jgi:hypothetical protein
LKTSERWDKFERERERERAQKSRNAGAEVERGKRASKEANESVKDDWPEQQFGPLEASRKSESIDKGRVINYIHN